MNRRFILLSAAMLVIVAASLVLLRGGRLTPVVSKAPTPAAPVGKPTERTTSGRATPPLPTPATRPAPPPASTLEVGDLALSPAVRTIIGLDGASENREARMHAVLALTRELAPDDVKALVLFLDVHSDDATNLPSRAMNALKNDVLDVLLRQNHRVEDLGEKLVGMYRDPKHDEVWRDYCVQSLAACYDLKAAEAGAATPKNNPAGAAPTPDRELTAIEGAYRQALTEKGGTIAGTALLGLNQLAGRYPAFNTNQLASAAVSLATDDTAGEPCRITALRICGMMRQGEALPSARRLAQTAASVPLRMAAIATLGDLGDRQDQELLQSMAQDPEKRVKTVATAALRNMQRRLEPRK